MRLKLALIVFLFIGSTLPLLADDCPNALQPGVELYKQARYAEAIEAFRIATSTQPKCLNAWLYLGTAYAQQYVPGADTRENVAFAEQAIQNYQKALELEPKNTGAIKGSAYLYLQMKSFDNAKEAYEKAAILEPSDPEVPYSVGVIDWMIVYERRMGERAKLGFKPTDMLPPGELCDRLRTKNTSLVDEGISYFLRALELRHDYDDAMAYSNLMYRERADLDCDDPELREKDLTTADNWVDRTMMVKKRRAEKKQPCGFQEGEIDPCFNSNDQN